jgi:hypothetical protein
MQQNTVNILGNAQNKIFTSVLYQIFLTVVSNLHHFTSPLLAFQYFDTS